MFFSKTVSSFFNHCNQSNCSIFAWAFPSSGIIHLLTAAVFREAVFLPSKVNNKKIIDSEFKNVKHARLITYR